MPSFLLEAGSWTAVGLVNTATRAFDCTGDYILLGGQNIMQNNGYFQKTFTNLPPHNIIYFSFLFAILDDWNPPDHFSIKFDDYTVGSNWGFSNNNYYGPNRCGGNAKDIMSLKPVGKVFHTASTLTIRITSHVTSPGRSFGFRDVSIQLGYKSASDTQTSCHISSDMHLYTSTYGCKCRTGQYQSGSCHDCSSACKECWGLGADKCYGCADGYKFDGTRCVQCPENCEECSSSNECTRCTAGFYHYFDNTCRPDCNNPIYYADSTECKPVCHLTDEFMLWDGSCSSTCELPLQQRIINGVKTCRFPCDDSQFLYPDGTCQEHCSWQQDTLAGKKLCKIQCGATTPYYYPSIQGCYPTCDSPLTRESTSLGIACVSGCSETTDFLYTDGSCKSTCPANRVQNTIAGITICYESCAPGYYYHLATGQCTEKCEAPFSITQNSEGVQICNPPCSNTEQFYYDLEKVCKPTCSYPYTIESQQEANLCILKVSVKEQAVIEQITSMSSKGETSTNAGAVATSILSSGDPGALGAGSLVKLLQYMRFLNIQYSPKLALALKKKVVPCGITFAPEISPAIKNKFQLRHLSEKFEEAQIHSSFFVNVWELTISLSFVLAAIIVVLIIEFAVKNSPKAHSLIQKVKIPLKWNLLLTVFCSNFGDLGLYTAIEIKTISFDSIFSVLSFGLCLALNGFAVFVLYRAMQITKVLFNIRKNSPPNAQARKIKSLYKKWESYQLLFQGFHNISVFQQMFTLNLVIRAYAINMIVAFLYDYPLVQTSIFTAMSCCMIIYLLIKMPMLSSINNIQQIVFEIIILIANICALIICIMDQHGTERLEVRNILGEVIIYTNIVLSVASPIFLALKLIVVGHQMYVARKAAQKMQRVQNLVTEASRQNYFDQANPVPRITRPRLRSSMRLLRPLDKAVIKGMRPVEREMHTVTLDMSRQMPQDQGNESDFG